MAAVGGDREAKESCIPFTRLRVFICPTMFAGTFGGLALLPSLFEIEPVTPLMAASVALVLALGLVILFLLLRGVKFNETPTPYRNLITTQHQSVWEYLYALFFYQEMEENQMEETNVTMNTEKMQAEPAAKDNEKKGGEVCPYWLWSLDSFFAISVVSSINHNQNGVISKMLWKNLHTLFYTLGKYRFK